MSEPLIGRRGRPLVKSATETQPQPENDQVETRKVAPAPMRPARVLKGPARQLQAMAPSSKTETFAGARTRTDPKQMPGGEAPSASEIIAMTDSYAEMRTAFRMVASGAKLSDQTAHIGEAGASVEHTTKVAAQLGKTAVTAETAGEAFAGAQAAARMLAVASDKELSAAITALARAGAWTAASGKFDIKRAKAALSGSGEVNAGAGAQARGSATAGIKDLNRGVLASLVAVSEFSVQVGASADAKGELSARFGPAVLSAVGQIGVFVGAAIEGKAAFYASLLNGVGGSVQGGARVSASSIASGTGTFGIDNVGQLELTAGVLAWAGAEAQGQAAASIGVSGISLSAKASAFAGAKLSTWSKLSGKLRGRTIVSLSGHAEVAVGVGVDVGGDFAIQGGKFKIGGELGAVLKGGATGGVDFEFDAYALAAAIIETSVDAYNAQERKTAQANIDYRREPLTDPQEKAKKVQSAYDAVIGGFDAYAREVTSLVGSGKAGARFIDRERLDKIVSNAGAMLDERYIETDEGIETAVRHAFGDLLVDVDIHKLKVHSLQPVKLAEATRIVNMGKEDLALRKATDQLTKELQKYGTKKQATGESGVKQEQVQSIIDGQWSKLVAVLGPEVARGAVVLCVNGSIGKYLGADVGWDNTAFQIDNKGKITKFGDPAAIERLAAEQKSEFKAGVALSKRETKYTAMQRKLSTYKAELLADEKATLDLSVIKRIVAETFGKLDKKVDRAQAAGEISAAVNKAMNPLLTGVTIDAAGNITAAQTHVSQLGAQRTKQAGDAKTAARNKVLDALTKQLKSSRSAALKSGKTDATSGQLWVAASKAVETAVRAIAKTEGAEPATFAAADADLEARVNAVLKPLIAVSVNTGRVQFQVTHLADAATFEEERRKERAKIKGDNPGADNERRAKMAHAVRDDLRTYANQVRTDVRLAAERGAKKKGAQPKPVERARLQEIIDRRTKKFRDDAATTAGDEAITDAVSEEFGVGGANRRVGLLKSFAVSGLSIADGFEATPVDDLLAEARANKQAGYEVAVIERVAAAVSKYAGEQRKRGKELTVEGLQRAVGKARLPARPSVPGDGAQDHDSVLLLGIRQGLPDGVTAEVKDGVVTAVIGKTWKEVEAPGRARARLKDQVATYAASCAELDRAMDRGRVQAFVTGYLDDLRLEHLDPRFLDGEITHAISEALGDAVQSVVVTNGRVTTLDVRPVARAARAGRPKR